MRKGGFEGDCLLEQWDSPQHCVARFKDGRSTELLGSFNSAYKHVDAGIWEELTSVRALEMIAQSKLHAPDLSGMIAIGQERQGIEFAKQPACMNNQIEFKPFPKIIRLSRACVVTEKLDGTNAQITITEDGQFLTGSRNQWITPEKDNYGFSKWAHANKEELLKLGVGSHFGEWWGQGIQRGYGLKEKRFSLFNVSKWSDESLRPACCHVVPDLAHCQFDDVQVFEQCLRVLTNEGSHASPGFMRPEGIVIFHVPGNTLFKKTIEGDGQPKGKQ
jgi:hypothetical protein